MSEKLYFCLSHGKFRTVPAVPNQLGLYHTIHPWYFTNKKFRTDLIPLNHEYSNKTKTHRPQHQSH